VRRVAAGGRGEEESGNGSGSEERSVGMEWKAPGRHTQRAERRDGQGGEGGEWGPPMCCGGATLTQTGRASGRSMHLQFGRPISIGGGGPTSSAAMITGGISDVAVGRAKHRGFFFISY
jgi:hypothetical protein